LCAINYIILHIFVNSLIYFYKILALAASIDGPYQPAGLEGS